MTTATAMTVAEFFKAMRKPRPRGARAQLDGVQAAVDRGWMTGTRWGTSDELNDGAVEVYRQYCLFALRRPWFMRDASYRREGVVEVGVGPLRGPRHVVSAEGRRALLRMATAAALIDATTGPDIGFCFRGHCNDYMNWLHGTPDTHVAVAADEADYFIASVKDVIEEHVKEHDGVLDHDED
jgi:hypothetical protein